MVLSRTRTEDSSIRVVDARKQLDEAVAKMNRLLNEVEDQATQAKEQLDERRSG